MAKIVNATDAIRLAAEAGCPAVVILKAYTGGPYGSGWMVRRLGFKTDPKRIHNGGNAHFRTIAEAKEWAGPRYGIDKWVRIKGLNEGYFPAQAKPVIEATLQAQAKQ